eukprot:756638-Hanusia_phi.AAC.1
MGVKGHEEGAEEGEKLTTEKQRKTRREEWGAIDAARAGGRGLAATGKDIAESPRRLPPAPLVSGDNVIPTAPPAPCAPTRCLSAC